MNIMVLMSGGFHPFHPGHLALYNSAKKAFPGADVVVGATNVQKDRPFNFKDKATLATIAGVDKGHFVEVNRQFSVKGEPNIENRIQNPDDTILILVRSVKDAKDPVLQPWKPNPDGSTPMTKGSKNHPPRPTSNYLLSYKGNEKQLQPMTKHAYIAFLPVEEFSGNMTSASEIRNTWPTLDDQGKQKFAMSLYPATQQNSKLLATVVNILNRNIGSTNIEQPDTSAIKQLKAKKLKEQIQRMRPLIKEASVEQKYKMLKLIKEAAQLDELNLFGKKIIGKDKLPQKSEPVKAVDDYRTYFSKTAPPKKTGTVYHGLGDYYDKTKKDAFKEEEMDEDWNKVNHHDKTDGMSSKAVKAYRRENPGSKLKTAVTTKPSKLKAGSKDAKRRKSFCARMSGNKGPMKKPNGKPTPKALALRRWNCESIEELEQLAMIAEQKVNEAKNWKQQAAIAIAKKNKKKSGISEGIETINGSKYNVDPNKYYVWAWDGAAVLYGEYDNVEDAKLNLPKIEQRAIERLGPYAKDAFELSTGKDLLQRYGKKEVNELKDETIHSYLSKADRQISNRLDRMSQARERLNKNYEIYDVNNPTKIIDRFEANTPELAREYFNKFIKEYNPGDQDFHFELRRSTGLSEENPNQQMSLYKPDGETYRKEKMPTLDNPDDIYNKGERYDFDDADDLPDELSDEPNMDNSIKELIKSKLDELEPRERKVLQLRFWHDMTIADIADRLNVSNERIRQIEARAMRKIRTATLDFNPNSVKSYVPEFKDYLEEK